MRYLGLESSCDETALAVWDTVQRKILYEQVLTQIDLHSAFGGVVPGVAIREHLNGFPILIEKINHSFDLSTIDKIVVTHGPGLMGCLGMGIAYAQSLELLLNIPVEGVNHLQGHALSPFCEVYQQDPHFSLENACPNLGLLVSGGNTLLFELEVKERSFVFSVIAQTIDDAAGEALDKGAKLLGFPYPGGPLIEKCALKGDPKWVDFPRAFTQKGLWKFSFSGLKTSLRYFLEKISLDDIEQHKPSICASYQAAVVGALEKKVSQALCLKNYKSLGLSGGVSNNAVLREHIGNLARSRGVDFYVPPRKYCGDNAAMIAFAGAFLTKPLKLNPNRTLDSNE